MQIVIEIPDEKYERLVYQDTISLRSYVENGIVLPKGHGRLKDIDKFTVNEIERMEYNYECGENECHSEEIVYLDDIINAETIIEADMAESEVENAE